MGIPKFFRYISERYPLTSQLIEENKIPEFDNLYLDFNGIIHNCSHPNDEDAHYRISEEQIFTSIFAYVDLLFGKIKPKKLFFMAVDGVAPRAKMNQQRSRRFRTAREAKEVKEKAESKGQKLPEEKAFDSNCITPGTPFMARLSQQLQYFINKKISEDSNWRDVQVVLSGHEVPGEGEHKIMEYIRLSRAQTDYNPNVRHCLYGLDADLIMLGLLSHDPHFCLLREEVKFGPSKKKGNTSLESLNFYLLHLSLMREYLDLEFRDIISALPFDYNLERVIDDFILLAVFVGNDFLPNLPDLHIHENGLERLFDVYKKVLPTMDGYMNDGGVINVQRLQVVLDEMAKWEEDVFQKEYADVNWYKGKQTKHVQEMELGRKRTKLVLTKGQREIYDQVKAFVMENRAALSVSHTRAARLAMPNTFAARERVFITSLSEDLHLSLTWDEYDEQDQNLLVWRFPGALTEPVPAGGAESLDDEEVDEESKAAVDRILKKYNKAPVMDEEADGGFDARHDRSIKEKMDEWKRNYYKGKLEISYDDPDDMYALAFRYVEGLQWVMHYYYSGVASWSWFYDYHYAPRISDLKGVDQMTFPFELGKPFHPFEQLMGVLPAASKEHVPSAFHDLMSNSESAIIDFYPLEFELDLNGKKQDWEAIVKIPFIDEKRLLAAMRSREHRLSTEEQRRNGYGTSTKFTWSAAEPTVYPSSLPGFFPPIYRCTCRMEDFDLPTLDGLHLVEGLCDGVFLGASALAGFPSLNTLPHVAMLGFHGVNVHGSESRNQSMVVHIENPHERLKTEEVARKLIGKRTFVGYPFLQEGLVVAVSDSHFKYETMALIPGSQPKVISNPHANGMGYWKQKAERIESTYSKKTGVITGPVEVLLHVRPLKGLKRLESGAFVKDYEGPEKEQEHAVQMVVSEVSSEDPRFEERPAPLLSEEFPTGSKIFFLGEHAYGVAAQVSTTTEDALSVILAFFPSDKAENEKFKGIVGNRASGKYYPSFKAAEMVGLSSRALSKITSSFMVITSDGQKTNLGLSLKFEGKGLKVVDYTRKVDRFWEFTDKAIQLLRDYKQNFPEVFRSLDGGGDGMAQAHEIFPGEDPDGIVKEAKGWLKAQGVRDFEPVALASEQLTKTVVRQIEALADECAASKSQSAIKKAIVKGIPRQAVLKPTHAQYRLQNQRFALGDRVAMVQDSGSVPLSVKGVVIGLNAKSIDVVWDVAFMSGVTMGDRCSPYRGSTVEFNSCLNLTTPQFVTSTKPGAQPNSAAQQQQQTAPPTNNRGTPMHIMSNPNRGRGGGPSRGAHGHAATPTSPTHLNGQAPRGGGSGGRGGPPARGANAPRGGPPPARGSFAPPRGGRGGGFASAQVLERGRGGAHRGRGRGAPAQPQAQP